MKIHIKICGITDVDGAMAAVDAGADAVGFVLAKSVRQVSPEYAADLASRLPQTIEKVAVFRRLHVDNYSKFLGVFEPDLIQADHSSLGSLAPERTIPVFREAAADREALDQHLRYSNDGRFLYEGPQSGVGRTVDWTVASLIAETGPMVLAGGLHPDNVIAAIRTVRPFGVDVSSGVESRLGRKDPARIRAFVGAVREAEKQMVNT